MVFEGGFGGQLNPSNLNTRDVSQRLRNAEHARSVQIVGRDHVDGSRGLGDRLRLH